MRQRATTDPAVTTNASTQLLKNVEAVTALYERAENGINRHQRGAEHIAAWLARPRALYVIVIAAFAWMSGNALAHMFGFTPVDPAPFALMQGVVSLSGLLLATTILITQHREGKLADTRAHLDLQINLLAETKIAKLIELVEELRRDMPSVRDRDDVEANAMQRPADPQLVVNALEARMEGNDDR